MESGVGLAVSGATAGAGAGALARAHAALLRDGDLQFSLPVYQEPKVPDWLQALGEMIRAIAPIFPYIFYAGLFVGRGRRSSSSSSAS